MKAIQTRYIGPTNFKPSRIKAWAEGWGSKTVLYNTQDDESNDQAHYRAVLALVAKFNSTRNTLK